MSRPRGFIFNWEPTGRAQSVIDTAIDIIDTSTVRPLTLRQIFYMMVTRYAYPKEEKSYKYLCEQLNKARRARLVDMDDIRDDGLMRKQNSGYRSKESFLYTYKYAAENFQLDRQRNQETKIYVWCEAGGMVPQLHSAVRDWHIPVLSSGGFDSVTTKYNIAKELASKKHVVVLHLGDHDPSGVHMFGSLDEDLQSFMEHIREEMGYDFIGNICELHRIAVTPEQVEEMRLPTSPPKATDNRSFRGLTTQCEAIDPEDLQEILKSNVLMWLDEYQLEQDLAQEKEIRAELIEKIGEM